MDFDKLTKNIFAADKLSIARAISIIENDSAGYYKLLKNIYKKTGKAYLIGITGPPGAGKSTITNCLTKLLREKNFTVGIIAVDPTSPFTGGALLGDRIRMQEIGMDEGVFIRSMATRGNMGGLSKKAGEACDILDASGKEFIIIETVGVGQSELDIAQTADTTIVTLVPESGDSVQTMKAGLMEIGDIFVINKSDRDGADALNLALKTMLHLKPKRDDDWIIPIFKTIGTKNKGIDALYTGIMSHKEHLKNKNLLFRKRKEHLTKKLTELVSGELQKKFWTKKKQTEMEKNLDDIVERKIDPYDFAEQLIKQ